MNRSTRAARLLLMPLLASALALADPLPAASAAPATPTTDPAFLPELVVPGQPLPQPRTETLLAAGAKGFLHTTQDATFAWTAYDTGATTVVGAYDVGRPDPGLHGAGSDVTIDTDPHQPSKVWKLRDMASGTVTTLNAPEAANLGGVYGDAVLADRYVPVPNAGTVMLGSMAFLRATADGSTVSVPITGWPDSGVVPRSVSHMGGDAKEAALGFFDDAGKFRIALADTHTGALRVSPPVASARSASASWFAGAAAIDDSHVAWIGDDHNVHVLPRADLAAAESVIPFDPYDGASSIGLSGDWLLSVGRPPYDKHDSAVPTQRELKATPIGGGDPVTVMPHASPTIAQAPDGTALVEGGDTAADWTVRKVTAAGGAAPSAVAVNYKVAPDSYRLDSLNLSANVLSSAESGYVPSMGFYERRVTPGPSPTVSAPRSQGAADYLGPNISCGGSNALCTDMVGTGDGRVVHFSSRGLVVRQDQNVREINTNGVRIARIVEADGRFLLLDTSPALSWNPSSLAVLDIDNATSGTPVATASTGAGTIEGGRLFTAGSNPGEITVLDLANQQTRTVQTGRGCAVTDLKSARGWLYWSCRAEGSAGLLRQDGTSRPIEVPARADGMGDGFLLYTNGGDNRSTVVDFHTGIPVTSSLKTRLNPSQLVNPWSVDRFGGGLVYGDKHQNLHLVSVIAPGTTFTTVSPERLLDTRSAVGRTGTDKVPGRDVFSLQVAGRANVPANAKAVVLNVTATETDGPGHLTVWASSAPQPTSSNLNWTGSGVTTPNLVVVPLDDAGRVMFFNGARTGTHLIADVFGYYV
ncbi:hypothetical protein [Streptomyces sp. CB01881]|uniref:hypothetical protein n=1 Tax=Streptomyces sp. CB01881 TaxID=2078691 RepID=UPI000CDCCA8D|nr:hypothetical protein [Streptomyces sp. CB01881]AUY49307.1 hypothetical protein C2142_10560 [Streptomyces sp. CB01881]TYC72696.1 hypothetical protein EH183_10560 [Streptomyces sp. CB01881]